MRKNSIITGLLSTCIVAASLLMPSCSGMNDLSDKFLKGGETIYAAMVDTVEIGSGKGRIKLIAHIKTNNVKTLRVYWSDREDSLDMNIDNNIGTFTTMLENMPERSYIFNFVSFDSYGNKSLIYEGVGSSYGSNYEAAFLDRNITSVAVNAAGGKVIKWGNIDTSTLDAKYNELTYPNAAGGQTTLKVPVDEAETIIYDLRPGTTSLQYNTVYIPDDLVVDTFSTASRTFNLPADGYFNLVKTNWTLVSHSGQVNTGGDNVATNSIDGNTNNRWHSNDHAFPHWLAIDLGETVSIGYVRLWPSKFDLESGRPQELGMDIRYCSKVRLYYNVDTPPASNSDADKAAWGANTALWTEIGEFDCNPTQNTPQVFSFTAVNARYFKFSATQKSPESGNNYFVMGELDIVFR